MSTTGRVSEESGHKCVLDGVEGIRGVAVVADGSGLAVVVRS